jgi:hypothetical protein
MRSRPGPDPYTVTISLETQLAPAGTAQQLVVSTVQVTGTVNVYAITAILNTTFGWAAVPN